MNKIKKYKVTGGSFQFEQTFVSQFNLQSNVNMLALADLISLGEPTPLSTKSPFSPSCLGTGENVPTDFESKPGTERSLQGSETTASMS